jgi:hypothetical protein
VVSLRAFHKARRALPQALPFAATAPDDQQGEVA